MAGHGGAMAAQQQGAASQGDPDICDKVGFFVGILYVTGQAPRPRQRIAPLCLGKTKKAGPDPKPARLGFTKQRRVVARQRPRPHQAHLTTQDIDHLRQFIEATGPEPAPEAVEPRGIRRPPCAHGSEFQQREGRTMPPSAGLAKQDGSAQGQQNSQRQQGKDRCGEYQGQRGYAPIKPCLTPKRVHAEPPSPVPLRAAQAPGPSQA